VVKKANIMAIVPLPVMLSFVIISYELLVFLLLLIYDVVDRPPWLILFIDSGILMAGGCAGIIYGVNGDDMMCLECVTFYTVGHKKRDTFIFVITLANIDRFS